MLAIAVFFTACAFAQTSDTAQISIPNVNGALKLNVGTPDFQTRVRPDGKEVQLRALGRLDRLEISAFLQQVTFPANAEKCRDEWWPDTKNAVQLPREQLQLPPVKDEIARVEYIIPEFKGIKVQQKNVHAYLGGHGLCAEVHISKAGFQPDDQKLFEELVSGIKLLQDAPPAVSQVAPPGEVQANNAEFYFNQGSKFYVRQDYVTAAKSYQKALDLEKQKHSLSKDYFRVLVDNLGMSYGINGKLEEARTTFEYGVTQDPEYPLFYYNLACAYGEMNKMEEALAQLRLVNKYKANMISGEPFPDPLQDDSFRFLVKNPAFVSAVREMQK